SLAAGNAVVPSPHPRSRTLSPFVIPRLLTSASPLSLILSAMRVKSPFSQSALFGFIRTLLLRSSVGLWGYNVFASRTAPLINPNEYLRRVLIAERFLHHGPKRPHEVALTIHQFAQTNVQLLDTIHIPIEGGDLVGQVKELHGEGVP